MVYLVPTSWGTLRRSSSGRVGWPPPAGERERERERERESHLLLSHSHTYTYQMVTVQKRLLAQRKSSVWTQPLDET